MALTICLFLPDNLNNGGNARDYKWTKAIAVGSNEYVGQIKSSLGAMAKGRKIMKADDGCQLREPSSSYMAHFDAQNEDIESHNTCYWDINNEYSTS